MKIACLSDTHGHFPEIPECDLLLLGGDYCPVSKEQLWWYRDKFQPWINELSTRMKIIGVAGNHDLLFENNPDIIPRMNWTYLQDSGCEFEGLNFWGSPWQTRFYDWAFNADEYEMKQKWAMIPENTDVLLLHGPPRGYGDFSPYDEVHTGSQSLTETIERIQPKLVIAGHIHSGYGKYKIGETTFLNCALVNEAYKPVNPIQMFEI